MEGAWDLSLSKIKPIQVNEVSSSSEPSTSSTLASLATFSSSEAEEKTCGICLEVVLNQQNPEQQFFGLLQNCNHSFCFACLKTWQENNRMDVEDSVACPQCRVVSGKNKCSLSLTNFIL